MRACYPRYFQAVADGIDFLGILDKEFGARNFKSFSTAERKSLTRPPFECLGPQLLLLLFREKC